jgi:hypothetical protein
MLIVIGTQFPDAFTGRSGFQGAALLFGVSIGLLLLQYARRRTQLARSIIGAFAAWSLIPVVWPNVEIAETGTVPPPAVEARFVPGRQPLDWRDGSGAMDRVEVSLPVELTGRERELLQWVLVDLRIESSGHAWHPRREWRTNLMNRRDSDWLEIALREEDFRRFQAQTVTVRAEFAVWVYEHRKTTNLRLGSGWQPVDGVGYMRFDEDHGELMGVRRTPLANHEAELIYTIPVERSEAPLRGEVRGVYPPNDFELHVMPVITWAAPFGNSAGARPSGNQVTLNVLRPVAFVKRSLTIEGVRLADWVVRR